MGNINCYETYDGFKHIYIETTVAFICKMMHIIRRQAESIILIVSYFECDSVYVNVCIFSVIDMVGCRYGVVHCYTIVHAALK